MKLSAAKLHLYIERIPYISSLLASDETLGKKGLIWRHGEKR